MPYFRNTILLLLTVPMLSGCWWNTYEWNQKLTLEVETPQGVKTAASVTQVTIEDNDFPLAPAETRGARSSIRGEAVVMEVVPGKFLFALLEDAKGLDQANLTQIFVDHPDFSQVGRIPGPTIESLWPLRNKAGTAMEVPPEDYPLLVTFTDIDDPASVQKVDPNNLEASFGPGVRLKQITLAITYEAVTADRVENVLRWINNLKQYRTNPNNPFTSTLPREIGSLRSR